MEARNHMTLFITLGLVDVIPCLGVRRLLFCTGWRVGRTDNEMRAFISQ